MSKRKRRNSRRKSAVRIGKNSGFRWHDELKEETKHSIFAIFSFALALIFALSAFDKAGGLGRYLFRGLELFFGAGFFLLPLAFFLVGLSFLFSFRRRLLFANIVGGLLFLISALGLSSLLFSEKTGGYAGFLIHFSLLKLFGFWASIIILSAFLAASILIIFNTHLLIGRILKFKSKGAEDKESEEGEETLKVSSFEEDLSGEPAYKEKEAEPALVAAPKVKPPEEELFQPKKQPFSGRGEIPFIPPPLKLLEGDRGKSFAGDIKANANIIKRTLETFGIDVEMGEISVGPSVTQYTLRPAEGVKLSKITALHNNLALALASHPIRIEAPIPGRSLVGIEIPNRSVSLVGLKNLLGGEDYQKSPQSLVLALGRDVSGSPVFANLSKMPHLLIAGSTGSGKSICIHSLLLSLVYRNSPLDLRFIMIDPKRVELSIYNNLPYLLTPVITDAKKSISALKWVISEMESRYELLSDTGSRDIFSYRREILARKDKGMALENMPYLVVVIDELADIMVVYPRELEAAIVRLAQMARAVGIHLVVSTQRPSVDVITGLIKANITTRIAFQVASQVDSRTILDRSGAERLLGNGDMLYLAGDSAKLRRIQGAFVSEDEIRKVTGYLAEEYEGIDIDGSFNRAEENKSEEESRALLEKMILSSRGEEEDDLYKEAKDLAVKSGKISASYLQRRLRVGYARAARLLDILEAKGIIGPADGAKPREVYLKPEEADKQSLGFRV